MPNLPALPNESQHQYRRRTVLVRLAESRGKNIVSPMSSLASLRSVLSSSRSYGVTDGSSKGAFSSIALTGASGPLSATSPEAAPPSLPSACMPLDNLPRALPMASSSVAEEHEASRAAPAAAADDHFVSTQSTPTAHDAGGDGMMSGALHGALPRGPTRPKRVTASTSRSLPFTAVHRTSLPAQASVYSAVARSIPQPTAATEGLTLLALCQYRQEGLVDELEFMVLKGAIMAQLSREDGGPSLGEEPSTNFSPRGVVPSDLHTAKEPPEAGALE